MGAEEDFTYLSHLPTQIFSDLIKKWENISTEFKPNGLFSEENREKTIEIIRKLKTSKLNHLKKLSRILKISNIWWQAYKIPKIKPQSNLINKKKKFDINKYLKKESTKIKGLFSTWELSEHAVLILVEFSSRSKLLRRKFRYIYLPSAKVILLEERELSFEIMKNEILPIITKEPDNIIYKRPNARLIKNLTQSRDESRPPLVLTYLKIKISLETSGIEGLSQITIQGNDVIRGAETLEQRHEISLKFMKSGPWIGAGTEDFKFEVGKGLQILRLEENSLLNLAAVLNRL